MTTTTRPTAEEIAALFAKHGIQPLPGAYYGSWPTDAAQPASACATGIIAFDAGAIDHPRDCDNEADRYLYGTFNSWWVTGVAHGFDGKPGDEGPMVDPDYREGYATGRAVRALVLGDALPDAAAD